MITEGISIISIMQEYVACCCKRRIPCIIKMHVEWISFQNNYYLLCIEIMMVLLDIGFIVACWILQWISPWMNELVDNTRYVRDSGPYYQILNSKLSAKTKLCTADISRARESIFLQTGTWLDSIYRPSLLRPYTSLASKGILNDFTDRKLSCSVTQMKKMEEHKNIKPTGSRLLVISYYL